MELKKILVTGGCGFIGSNFIRYILNKNPELEVVNIDSLTYCGNLENLKDMEQNPRYSFVEGNICDVETVKKAMQDVQGVVHFAAESHVDNSITDPFIFTKTNVLGTHVLLECAKDVGIERFLHVSTDEVYGSILEGSFKEDDKMNPSSPYSGSKAAAELIVKGFVTTFKFPAVIVRGSNAFGPYQYPEKVIPLFSTNLIEGKKVPLYGDGKHVRSWVYVIDFCKAVECVFEKGVIGEAYNIPGVFEVPNIELTKRILAVLGKDESFIERVEDRLAHDRRYSVDGTKLESLGWKADYGFDDALRETVEWYRNNEDWWKKLKNK